MLQFNDLLRGAATLRCCRKKKPLVLAGVRTSLPRAPLSQQRPKLNAKSLPKVRPATGGGFELIRSDLSYHLFLHHGASDRAANTVSDGAPHHRRHHSR
jgi:hypothetical protein